MNLSKRYFKIIDDSNIPFKNMHNIRNGTVLEYVRHQPELRSVQLKKEHGYISMMEESVEEVEMADALAEIYTVEFNGDCYQSVFPSAEAELSQLHRTMQDALDYFAEVKPGVNVEVPDALA